MCWLYFTQAQGKKEKQVILISQNKQDTPPSNSSLPSFPEQAPKYPLRNVDTNFQQIGTLTNNDADDPIILPLFGRPLPSRKDRWEYYTATDKFHMLKIPILFEQKDCLEEVGCQEIYNKDKVYVPSYQKEFEVQLYKYRNFSYSPN
jgi:hypothetical protein